MLSLRGLAASLLTALIVVACSSAATASPSPSPSPTAAPTLAPSPSASPTPAPTPSPTPRPTPSPTPRPTPAPSFTAEERQLADRLRLDVRRACVPSRSGRPDTAIAAVECVLGTALVDRVVAVTFGRATDAQGNEVDATRQAYLDHLAGAKVTPGSGNCAVGTPGDRSWPASLPDEGEDGGLSPMRSGCFLDQGTATVELTCYGPFLVEVTGKTAGLAELYAWAWQVAPGESTDRDPPGLCAAPD